MPADPNRVLYLSRADVIRAGLTMPDIIAALEAAFIEKGHSRVEMPPKPGIHPGSGDNFIHAMPAIPTPAPLALCGVATWQPGAWPPYINGLLILNDPRPASPPSWTGLITAARTGAAIAPPPATWPAATRQWPASSAAASRRSNLEALAVEFR